MANRISERGNLYIFNFVFHFRGTGGVRGWQSVGNQDSDDHWMNEGL